MATEFLEAEWAIQNSTTGWLMTEGCVFCGARRSFFSHEQTPPLDSYVEGNHYWRDFEGAQAIRFDLVCGRTGTTLKLDNFLGLALCKSCNPNCLVAALGKLLKPDNIWVYVALCADPYHASSKCVSSEQTIALTDYFNSQLRGTRKRILVVPCVFRKEPNCCRGQVIAELGGMNAH
jgi:hypothetical protein